MKKTLQLFAFLFTCLFIPALPTLAQTNPPVAMGADLTYVNVAPNIFVVQYKYYRDCSATGVPATMPLVYQAAGCNAGATVPLQKGTSVLGQPYCGQQGCIPGRVNYNEITYNGTIILPALCNNWVLSVNGESRMGHNMAISTNNSLYSENTVNNVQIQTNTSPVFGNVPVIFVLKNHWVTFNQNVTDFDGDTLMFALTDPLNGHNSPAAFKPGFSATQPLGSGTTFSIDPFTGAVYFRSTVAGDSLFNLRVAVTEYRTINGVYTNLGTTNRDLAIVTVNPFPPKPFAISFSSKGQPLKQVYEIGVLEDACIPITITRTSGSTPIVVVSNGWQSIPGSTITVTGNDSVKTLMFCWKPRYGDIRSTPHQFMITVRNSDCPIPGFITQAILIKVVKKKRVEDPGPIDVVSPQPTPLRVSAPNIITPNNDGKNDVFVIQGISENAELLIYDRNRRLVKSFKHYRNNWSAEGLKDGAYFYILKDRETGEVLKGSIEVIR